MYQNSAGYSFFWADTYDFLSNFTGVKMISSVTQTMILMSKKKIIQKIQDKYILIN